MRNTKFYTNIHDDVLLYKRIQEDDHLAFQELYHKYFKKLREFSNHIVNDKQLAQDIIQSLFIYIWENRKNLHVKYTLKGYLWTAVRRKSLISIEQQKKMLGVEELNQAPTDLLSPEQQLEKENFQEFIEEHLKRLIAPLQEIYHLKYIHNMKQKDIALILQVSESTIEKKVTFIKTYLKKIALRLN